MTDLHVADNLTLPLDLLVQKTAILGRSGSGKTNAATVVVEELLAAKQQVVILDPPGAWWGLRSSANGKDTGCDIIVLGGQHADAPILHTQGALVAKLAVEEHLSLILDLSDFSLGHIIRFSLDFMNALYELKARARDAMLLVIEEADEILPQHPEHDQTQCLGAGSRIAKRGRARGIGLLLISQRSASLNKNPLSQTELLIALQTTDPRDITAIDDWIKNHETPENRQAMLATIATLPVGTGFISSPAWLKTFQQVNVRKRHTFDSSATPQPGVHVAEPDARARIDMDAIAKLLAPTEPEDDPTDHNPKTTKTIHGQAERIHQLESADLAKLEQIGELIRENQRLQASIDNLSHAQTEAHAHIDTLRAALHQGISAIEALEAQYATQLIQASERKNKIHLVESPSPQAPKSSRKLKSSDSSTSSEAPKPKPAASQTGITYQLRNGESRIMEIVAMWHGSGINRQQLATLAGLSHRSGSFGTYLSNLQKLDIIAITPQGYVPGPKLPLNAPKSPPTHEQLMDLWCRKLKPSIARALRYLEAHPNGLTRQQLAGLMNMSPTSGSFGQYISELKKNQLTETTKTHIKPSRYLWPKAS